MRNQVLFRASPITSLFMAKDASIQSDRRGERLNSTTNTAPRCTLWLSISIFSAHPSSKNWSSRYYKGYIPDVLVLDARGEPLYNQSGEVESRVVEEIFQKSLVQ